MSSVPPAGEPATPLPGEPEAPVLEPRRSLTRRLLAWVLSWGDHPSALWALFLLAVAESVFFPIPPDVLLIAMVLGARSRWALQAAVCSLGSVLGGVLGYAIGALASDLAHRIVDFYGLTSQVAGLEESYGRHAFLTIWIAGFTPVPYKLITITAGLCQQHVSLPTFIAASAASRPLRFFLVGVLLYYYGPPARRFLERYFNAVTLILALLVVVAVLVLKPLLTGS